MSSEIARERVTALSNKVLHCVSDIEKKLDIMEVVAGREPFLTLLSPLSAKIVTK